MRMSDEEYFRSCVAKERHLAQLLGHHNVEEFYENAGTLWEDAHALPKWTRDWNACGPLMTQYDLTVHFHSDPKHPHGDSIHIDAITVRCADHPTKDHAVRYAIVKAVISYLEHTHVDKDAH